MASELRDPTKVFPHELSCFIFSFIPAENLVKDCVLVCHFWKQISDDNTTWRLKCERTRRYVKKYMKNFEPRNWKHYYYTNACLTENILHNPNLEYAHPNVAESKLVEIPWSHLLTNQNRREWEDQFEPWEMIRIGSDGIQLECPPVGCGPIPHGDQVCIATSYNGIKRCQVIDLVAEGVPEYVLDECKLPIYVCEWFNNRWDCGVKYGLTVRLLDREEYRLPDCKFSLKCERPEGKHEWEKLEHTFRDYPVGVRYIMFKDYGRGTRLEDGYYGAKLTGATVRFLFE